MAFETGTEELTCPSCGARHLVRWSRMPVREQTTIRCIACKAVAYQAKTVRDYYDVRLA